MVSAVWICQVNQSCRSREGNTRTRPESADHQGEDSMKLEELRTYLDEYLAIGDVPDWADAYNGLEVEGKAEIRRVATAVGTCLATIRAAVEAGADMMIVHHGLFWGVKAP